ncbi:PREDICTED: rho guanine nucleotide exchange factor 38 isoform X2 [Chinchilla lanigera]|uniref:rho guanine nucleotide exchange factor 38 isoform X2 n=1 Tax=Chinchilla lanigera TaxID=34839 RepID=UPI00038EAEF4|nr:PREDICTED: rho guanine nucleotide exchange factor 38 isoform X2 [Chinchilla lanigera]
MEPKDPTGKENVGTKKKNLTFLRSRLYMLERRKTDTMVEGGVSGDHSGALRRSQSDRTEYSQKLQEKMTPQANGPAAASPSSEEEHQVEKMMAKRANIIKELIQTEKDYVNDLALCVREVVQPLRNKQIERLDVESLFSNIESVHEISAKLLSLLEEATTNVEPAMQVIGEVFLQIKGPLEEIYKIYCYQHDEAQSVLESCEEEELMRHVGPCLQSLKKIYVQEGKANLLDMGSLMIRPIQRLMKYPLLLCELHKATPPSHPDRGPLEEACAAVRAINVNINEQKRRKDLVLKYKKNDEDESLKDKLSRLNIHSISKKSKRVTNHLKILTRGESQVKDTTFNKEEKLFRSLEKTVRQCVKNISFCLQDIQTVTELQEMSQPPDEEEQGSTETPRIAPDPCHDFAAHLQQRVLNPLSALLSLFPGPQKLIQKRYDKLLDYNSYSQRSGRAESDLAKREYEALNAQLLEELQAFNQAARTILMNSLCSFVSLVKDLMLAAQQDYTTILPVPLLISHICEIQNRVLVEIQNLNFVKENSATFIERKLSFEKKKPMQSQPDVPPQTDTHRSKLLSTYSTEELYQAKRKCNATQEHDINLLEGELVAVVEQKDPLGSTSRWLVDTGNVKGYVYSCFLKPYNPAKAQMENRHWDDDFDNISFFVSSRPVTDSVTGTPEGSISDSSSSLSGTCGKCETNGTDIDSFQEVDEQIFYAVHAFQARSTYELSLQEYQRVHILRFCDLSGNKEWWLAEAQGQKGYVPANYLGKMTYA